MQKDQRPKLKSVALFKTNKSYTFMIESPINTMILKILLYQPQDISNLNILYIH